MRLTLISEGAKTLDQIRVKGLFVLFQPDAESTADALHDPAPRVNINLAKGRPQDGSNSDFFGGIEMEIPYDPDDREPIYDVGVYAVHSEVPHGYGPFLYDLAAEYASMHGFGIMSAVGAGERLLAYKDKEYRRAASSGEAAGLWRGYNKRRDVKRAYGGPGFDPDRSHMTAPLRKAPNLLLQLQKLGLIVDRGGNVVDFKSAV